MDIFRELSITLNYLREQLIRVIAGNERGSKGGVQERTSADHTENSNEEQTQTETTTTRAET